MIINSPYVERLRTIFERSGVKVVTEIPPGTKVDQVVGIQEHFNREMRVTVRKGDTLFLVSTTRDKAWEFLVLWKAEIANRKDPLGRWEPWEIFTEDGSPLDLRTRLLRSRLRAGEKDLEDVKLFL